MRVSEHRGLDKGDGFWIRLLDTHLDLNYGSLLFATNVAYRPQSLGVSIARIATFYILPLMRQRLEDALRIGWIWVWIFLLLDICGQDDQ